MEASGAVDSMMHSLGGQWMDGGGSVPGPVTKGLVESVVGSCVQRQREKLHKCSYDQLVDRVVSLQAKQARGGSAIEQDQESLRI